MLCGPLEHTLNLIYNFGKRIKGEFMIVIFRLFTLNGSLFGKLEAFNETKNKPIKQSRSSAQQPINNKVTTKE